jgi:uncharacterized repeat protein (TIGR04138 family)
MEIIDSGLDDRYRTGAYEFVLTGLDYYQTKLGEKRHVSGQELSKALLVFAHKQFGLMAKSVFDYWGVKTTGDLGCIVYNMIRVGMMGKQPHDSLDDFYNVVDVEAAFEFMDTECVKIDREFVRRMRGV